MIYIVDDHADICKAMVRLLQISGHEARSFQSGSDAMPALHADPPNLLILDMMMPGMSRLDVMREIRSDPELSKLQVIMLSATSNCDDIQEAKRMGIWKFVPKASLDWAGLASVIDEALQFSGRGTLN